MGGHGSQCLSALLNGSKLDKEEEKNHGAHLRFACLIAQPIQRKWGEIQLVCAIYILDISYI